MTEKTDQVSDLTLSSTLAVDQLYWLKKNRYMDTSYEIQIYWRLGAIISTTCSFISLSVVLYFLIVRRHPDRPDETDAKERERFYQIEANNGNNLCNELLTMILFNCSSWQKLVKCAKNKFCFLFSFNIKNNPNKVNNKHIRSKPDIAVNNKMKNVLCDGMSIIKICLLISTLKV